MSNTTTKIWDLIPDSLKPQLMLEVSEILEENRKKEQEEKDKPKPEDQAYINELVKTMM